MATPRSASATPHRANPWSGSGLGTNRKAAAVDIRWPGGGTQRLADVKADASFWYAQFLYGLRHCFENDLQLALRPLEKAHRLNPRDPRAALYLRLAYESLGQTAEALALYQEARGRGSGIRSSPGGRKRNGQPDPLSAGSGLPGRRPGGLGQPACRGLAGHPAGYPQVARSARPVGQSTEAERHQCFAWLFAGVSCARSTSAWIAARSGNPFCCQARINK